MELDQWQKDFISYKGDKVLVSGRQTGKSEAAAYDNAEFAINNPGTNALILSKTERQAEEMIIKCLNYLLEFYPKRIGRGRYKPLKSTIWIVHGKKEKPSRVMCLPVGLAGEGIKGFTIHKRTIDEAQLVPDAVDDATSPMLLTTGGFTTLLGTPKGKKGFFWKAFENKLEQWKVFHINSEQVANERPISPSWPEWKRKAALTHLAKEKLAKSAKVYRQEYLGEFVEDLDQLFSYELINERCNRKRPDSISEKGKYYIGVDVGRSIDPSTFEIFDASNENLMEQVENIVRKDLPLTKTAEEILLLEGKYKFKGIGVDGGGMGAGVIDFIRRENAGAGRKTFDLNNAKRVFEEENDKERKKILLKEDMYRTLLILMEKGEINLLDDDDIKASLASVQIEYKEGTHEPIIFASDNHIVEGIIRAVYLAEEKKSLNLWCYYS